MSGNRLHNFNAGPAVLPEEVLDEARENLASYQGSGIGIMEMSHRSKAFEEIITRCEENVRELLGIDDSYAVIFATGGGSAQFSMVPMNLLSPSSEGNYILTGVWAEGAAKEAEKFGRVHIAASSKDESYRRIPTATSLSENPAYLHFTSNNTVVGSQFAEEPDAGKTPLVCDASSDFLSRKIDVKKYGLIYAGAQKNLGPAGVTLAIIRKDLLARIPDNLPLLYDYRTYVEHRSLYNTPPVFPIYVVGLMLKWIMRGGGVSAMEQRNNEKAETLYKVLDETPMFEPFIERTSRSKMNITFRIKPRELEERFVSEAEAAGFIGLKGHRLVGGLRVSIYNACPAASVNALAAFMREFASKN